MINWTAKLDLRWQLEYSQSKMLVSYTGKFESIDERLEAFQKKGIKARQCIIGSKEEWNEIANTMRLGGDNTPERYAEVKKADPKYNHLTGTQNLQAITAYHPGIDKRLLADGGHTCTAIASDMKNEKLKAFPPLKIYEFYGDKIGQIFAADFHSLM